MCFDIDVNKLSLPELRDTLRRITMLLSKPVVVNNLPDKGHQLRQVKQKLIKEIRFREGLERTHEKMKNMNLKCASETDINTAHCTRLCSFDRRPERERFRPNLSRRSMPSGRTESAKELHSGTKLIDLTTSLNIQKEQEDRVKAEQLRAKQEKLFNFLKEHETDESSEDTFEFNLSDYSAEEDVISEEQEESISSSDKDEPGPSGLSKMKKLKTEQKTAEDDIELDGDTTEVNMETSEPKKEMEPNTDIAQIKSKPMESDTDFDLNSDTSEVKIEAMESENLTQENTARALMENESEESEEKFQLNAAIADLIAEAIELKEMKYSKRQADST